MKVKYKKGDIVLVRSRSCPAIEPIHVKLIKKNIVKATKGRHMDWPGYVGWEAVLIYKHEATELRKRWSIPFKYPDQMSTHIYEEEIIKKHRR